MAGDWSSTDLAGLLTEFAKRLTELIPPVLQRFRPLAVVRQPRSQHNSRAQARRNIAEHYDLSNDLFAEFLDETMTYSSALFGSLPAGQSCLADAQRRKIDRLLDAARVGPGSRVLEIGTGWGELCIRAATRGRARPLDHPVGRAAATGPSAGGRGGIVRPRRDRPVRLPRRRWPLRRRAVRGDDRGGRIPLLAHVLSGIWTGSWRPAAGSRFRPSPCRTTGCWPAATRTRGSRSTSFPADCCRRPRRSSAITDRHTRLRTVDMFSLRPHYAETLRLWRERFIDTPGCVGGVGFRRGVPPDVGAVPGILRGRVSGPGISTSTSGPSHRRASGR